MSLPENDDGEDGLAQLRAAYDPERFRADGHRLIDRLADYLAAAAGRADGMPVLPWAEPHVMRERFPPRFPPAAATGEDAFIRLMDEVLAGSNHLHHPRYVGHQVTAPLPLTALCEMVSALLNNGMAVFEMGPASTAMERAVLGWMGRALGYGDGADGVLTSGGSAGNLTALLAARQAKAGYDVWSEGAGAPSSSSSSSSERMAVLVAEQAHYSVARAAQIMGWGRDGAISVPVDARYRMRADELENSYRAAERAGRRVIAVVASAASTSTGAYDPIDAIADFCERRDLWLHVDGAHGAAAAISDKYRYLVRGIERADSVVWDAHKMLLMPALVTAVLFRDGRRSYQTFAQKAAYLFEGEGEWWDIGRRTLECTKRMMSLKVYAALAVHGTKLFSDYVTATYDLARRFAERIKTSPDFELAVDPDCNIVCFRYPSKQTDDIDALQSRIRRRLLEDGSFYLVETRLDGKAWLRTTLINPLTTDSDLEELLAAIRLAALDWHL